ncbi:MAG TPA: putative quinol monooxygenase [Chitinophagales bacterium]|nr:antibiotic biosynthesis monooxygenase [Chitinophagales bacterium]HPE98273.1 putative quinol monooxygenase [Chitinophagales bacterium]
MYLLHGKLTAKKGQEEALAKILLQASELVAGAAGCRLYVISNDEQDPQQVYVTEIWDDKTAHDASLQMPEVRQLIQQAMPLLDGMPTGGQELTILGGHGV